MSDSAEKGRARTALAWVSMFPSRTWQSSNTHRGRSPSQARVHLVNGSPEQDAGVKRRGRRRVMDDRRSDREKKRKGFDSRSKIGDIKTSRVKAEKIKDRIAWYLKANEHLLAPFAKGKMF